MVRTFEELYSETSVDIVPIDQRIAECGDDEHGIYGTNWDDCRPTFTIADGELTFCLMGKKRRQTDEPQDLRIR